LRKDVGRNRKDPRLRKATTSEEGEDIRQDLQGDPKAGDRKENSWVFRQNSKNEFQDIMEGSAPSETEEYTTNCRLRAMDVGALTTLGTVALTNR
jgi:hypothetical protein